MIVVSILACLLFVGAFGYPTDPDDFARIVGGSAATLGQFKWVVSLQSRGSFGGHFCGGSILSEGYVLTAAHCVYGNSAENIQVQYGVIDIKYITPPCGPNHMVMVSEIIVHPEYQSSGNYPNDIAILKLERNMVLDNVNSGPVTLPNAPLQVTDQTTVQLCGWGYRSSSAAQVQQFLLWTDMPMWSSAKCSQYVGSVFDSNFHVCAGTLDGQHKQCSGDSGGPLTQDGVQYGIVSWSYKPCTVTDRPGVFTNVANHRQWIKAQTGV